MDTITNTAQIRLKIPELIDTRNIVQVSLIIQGTDSQRYKPYRVASSRKP